MYQIGTVTVIKAKYLGRNGEKIYQAEEIVQTGTQSRVLSALGLESDSVNH